MLFMLVIIAFPAACRVGFDLEPRHSLGGPGSIRRRLDAARHRRCHPDHRMGVDSNVLVFERIREELRNGKSAAAAVDAGFDKAFLTIIDTHVTTVVSAFFLFLFGTGRSAALRSP